MSIAKVLIVSLVVSVLGCGGKHADSHTPIGDTHFNQDRQIGMDAGADAGILTIDGSVPTSIVTFRLHNSGDEDLVFSMDRGWQPIIFAHYGVRPNAKSILMFPKHCTAACEVPEEERCPYCVKNLKAREEKRAEKRLIVPPQGTFEVPWDGEVFVYEKTRGIRDGRRKSCRCYTTQPAPSETYFVTACGLRITKEATKRSNYQCIKGTMTFPPSEPLVLTFDFPNPE